MNLWLVAGAAYVAVKHKGTLLDLSPSPGEARRNFDRAMDRRSRLIAKYDARVRADADALVADFVAADRKLRPCFELDEVLDTMASTWPDFCARLKAARAAK